MSGLTVGAVVGRLALTLGCGMVQDENSQPHSEDRIFEDRLRKIDCFPSKHATEVSCLSTACTYLEIAMHGLLGHSPLLSSF